MGDDVLTIHGAQRLFVAIPADAAFRSNVAEVRRRAAFAALRWVQPSMLHVTLVPPFMSGEAHSICRELRRIASRHRPLSLVFERLSFGPTPSRPHLLWATGSASGPLLELQQELVTLLAPPDSGRPFLLHATLARYRGRAEKGSRAGEWSAPIGWRLTARHIVLYQSVATPGGIRYLLRCRARLGGEGVGK